MSVILILINLCLSPFNLQIEGDDPFPFCYLRTLSSNSIYPELPPFTKRNSPSEDMLGNEPFKVG